MLAPGKYSRGFSRFMGRYARGLMRRKFSAVRIARDTARVLAELNDQRAPVLILVNHASWWDPLTGLLLAQTYLPARSSAAPMDARELAKFSFFKRLGIFGIDPDDPASLGAMAEYVRGLFAREERPTLWITPQGAFADVRAAIEIRPGAAAIAASTAGIRAVCVAIEYQFWNEQKPEAFIRIEPCAGEPGSTTRWQRAITDAMERNQQQLARLVIARDPGAFDVLVGRGATVHPLYDLWLRATGRTIALGAQRNSGAPKRGIERRTDHPAAGRLVPGEGGG